MRRLTGKVVIVAGGASGTGAATARRLTEEGANVMIGDLDGDRAAKLAAELEERGGRAAAHPFDIAQDEDCASLVAAIVEASGAVDGLFNVAADLSAGTLGRDTDLVDVPLDVWLAQPGGQPHRLLPHRAACRRGDAGPQRRRDRQHDLRTGPARRHRGRGDIPAVRGRGVDQRAGSARQRWHQRYQKSVDGRESGVEGLGAFLETKAMFLPG